MSAELLRRAATILRERAEAATPGPWKQTDGFRSHDDDRAYVVPTGREVHYVCAGGVLGVDEDAPYIATMHPGVGLAIAKWLEDVAAGWMWDADPDDIQTPDGWPLTLDESMDSHALTVALLIVGESND